MRRARFATCLVALLCAACAAQAVAPRTADILKVYEEPAGYYPGIEHTISVTPELSAWLQNNQLRIDIIQNRIVAVRAGKSAPACIGEDQYTCVASLAQQFAITDSYSGNNSVVDQTAYDVNGKPANPGKFEFVGYVPKSQHDNDVVQLAVPTKFAMSLGRDGSVSLLEARLPGDPIFAHTQDEYDATDAYETIAAVAAQECPTLSRADVAKWIENTIKPSSKAYHERVRRGAAEAEISKKTAFCGRSFRFNSVWAGQTYNQYRRDVTGGMALLVE
ncbi:MAG: hypothetical protein WB760_29585 [Xanthobacteraceae bacterium]